MILYCQNMGLKNYIAKAQNGLLCDTVGWLFIRKSMRKRRFFHFKVAPDYKNSSGSVLSDCLKPVTIKKCIANEAKTIKRDTFLKSHFFCGSQKRFGQRTNRGGAKLFAEPRIRPTCG